MSVRLKRCGEEKIDSKHIKAINEFLAKCEAINSTFEGTLYVELNEFGVLMSDVFNRMYCLIYTDMIGEDGEYYNDIFIDEQKNAMLRIRLASNSVVPIETLYKLVKKWDEKGYKSVTPNAIASFTNQEITFISETRDLNNSDDKKNAKEYPVYKIDKSSKQNAEFDMIVTPLQLKSYHDSVLKVVLLEICRPPSRGGPCWGRLGKGNIVVYSKQYNDKPDNVYNIAKSIINERFSKNKSYKEECIKFTNEKPKDPWIEVFGSNVGGFDFHIYQKKDDKKNIKKKDNGTDCKRDVFKPCNTSKALGKLKRKIIGKKKGDKWLKLGNEALIERIRETAKIADTVNQTKPSTRKGNVMGTSAAQFAAIMAGVEETKLNNKYEWLHRIAHHLKIIGADEPDNLMCGSYAANTWMIVYEYIADLALESCKKPSVTIKCEPIWEKDGIEWPAYAPPKINYSVTLNKQNVFFVEGLDILRPDSPSRWILPVLDQLYGKMAFPKIKPILGGQ